MSYATCYHTRHAQRLGCEIGKGKVARLSDFYNEEVHTVMQLGNTSHLLAVASCRRQRAARRRLPAFWPAASRHRAPLGLLSARSSGLGHRPSESRPATHIFAVRLGKKASKPPDSICCLPGTDMLRTCNAHTATVAGALLLGEAG